MCVLARLEPLDIIDENSFKITILALLSKITKKKKSQVKIDSGKNTRKNPPKSKYQVY